MARVDVIGSLASPRPMKTNWDVYLEVRKASRPLTVGDVQAMLALDGAATARALDELHRAKLVWMNSGDAVSYEVGRDARTDAEARALATSHGVNLDAEITPYGGAKHG